MILPTVLGWGLVSLIGRSSVASGAECRMWRAAYKSHNSTRYEYPVKAIFSLTSRPRFRGGKRHDTCVNRITRIFFIHTSPPAISGWRIFSVTQPSTWAYSLAGSQYNPDSIAQLAFNVVKRN